jgi:hypothetical protein
MLKPGVRVIEAHVHIGCHPISAERVRHQPTLAGIKGASVPSGPERLGLPWIPAPSHRPRAMSARHRFLPSHAVGFRRRCSHSSADGGPPTGVASALVDPALINLRHAMLTEDQPVGLPPVMSVPTSIVISSLGNGRPGAVEPRRSLGVERFRLVGWQSVGGSEFVLR